MDRNLMPFGHSSGHSASELTPDRGYVIFDISQSRMSPADKPIVWLRGEVKTPPFSAAARIEAGFLLRRLQQGETLGLPQSRPMPGIGSQCHELRVNDGGHAWRLIYYVESDAVVILDVFSKKTQATPKATIETCRKRLNQYQRASRLKR